MQLYAAGLVNLIQNAARRALFDEQIDKLQKLEQASLCVEKDWGKSSTLTLSNQGSIHGFCRYMYMYIYIYI